ncbi:MAG: hypothetical protein K2P78_01060 [Gemmataceae bacterium]|nr:hypothetical protein [Gemmataceae bacterium]
MSATRGLTARGSPGSSRLTDWNRANVARSTVYTSTRLRARTVAFRGG